MKVKVCAATDWRSHFFSSLSLICLLLVSKHLQESVWWGFFFVFLFFKWNKSCNILHHWSGKWNRASKLIRKRASIKHAGMSSTCTASLCGDEKRTWLLFWPTVLTLVPKAAPCLRSLHVSCVWKGSEQHDAAAAVSARVTWLFSSPHAAIMAGQGVKGTTVAKHAGIHALWVTLPPDARSPCGFWRRLLLGDAGSCFSAAWKPTYGALVLVRPL